MNQPIIIRQQPEPGKKLLRFRGDTVTFSLILPRPIKGQAVLRTNLGHAHITRQEIIQTVDENLPKLGRGWFDIPMVVEIPGRFRLKLPLTDVGHFQAKAMFILILGFIFQMFGLVLPVAFAIGGIIVYVTATIGLGAVIYALVKREKKASKK